MNVNDLFPSRFIKAPDLGDKHITLIIRAVVMEEVHGEDGKEQKPTMYFERAKKGLLLNKTNAMVIAGLYGPETDAWVGVRITLYGTQVRAFGKMQDAVRVEERKPAPAKATNGHTAPPIEEPPAALNEVAEDDFEEELNLNVAAGLA